MSRDDLFELFFNGSEFGSVEFESDDLKVRFSLFENVSYFYCMGNVIARYDLTCGILNCRPFSVRLTSDKDYSLTQMDDYSYCIDVINDILLEHVSLMVNKLNK